jgi:hypothetical protein
VRGVGTLRQYLRSQVDDDCNGRLAGKVAPELARPALHVEHGGLLCELELRSDPGEDLGVREERPGPLEVLSLAGELSFADGISVSFIARAADASRAGTPRAG